MKLCCLVLCIGVSGAFADINYGPYTFADNAFADRAQVNVGGTLSLNSALDLDEALVGFTPDSGLYNIGAGSNANDFTLFFDDLIATDLPGADIVLFDLRYSADTYEVAVISGATESLYISYNFSSQVNTGEVQDAGAAIAWAIEIDLADYGFASADAIHFRAGLSDIGNVQGDPTMAAVLAVPAPGAGVLLLGAGALLRRRR